MDDTRLVQLYEQIPALDCKRRCSHSCATGPIRIGRAEYERIVARLGYEPKGDPSTWVCPLLKDGLCTVYDIRPAICRIWGTTHKLACKHGCKPARWLSEGEVSAILGEVYQDGISYDIWGEREYWEGKKRMNVTLDFLKQKREEYRQAFDDYFAKANANHGAMQALDEIIAKWQEPEPSSVELAAGGDLPDPA